MLTIFQNVALLLIFVAVGFFLTKTKVLNGDFSQIISGIVVYFFLPCNIIKTMGTSFTVEYVSNNYKTLLVSLGVITVIVIAAHFLVKLLSKDKYERYVCEYSLIISNSGYMGYPLSEALFGTSFPIMVFGLPFSLYIYTVGFSGLTKRKLTLKGLLNPIILTTLAGMALGLSGLKLPTFIQEGILEKGSACMGPCCMLLTGIVIAGFNLKDVLLNAKVYIVSALRLVGIPILAGGVLSLFFGADIVESAVLYTALPCGLNTVVFARLVGENSRTAAGLALVSTIASCVTIPIIFSIFGIKPTI